LFKAKWLTHRKTFYNQYNKLEGRGAGHQWLTPVILATQEAEIRRIMPQSQPGDRIQETTHKEGLVEGLKGQVLS
jgi:hypothetical protein